MFPAEKRGSLDPRVLRKLGLTRKQITDHDALFLSASVAIVCYKKSGITNDPQMSCYSKVESISNTHALSTGLGGSYVHTFKFLKVIEFVHLDGVIVRVCVYGSSNGAKVVI
jgi:hypothetical protein